MEVRYGDPAPASPLAALTRKLDELARVRALYTRLAEGHEDGPAEDLEDDGPSNAGERLDLERLADELVGYGERLGFFGRQATPDPKESG